MHIVQALMLLSIVILSFKVLEMILDFQNGNKFVLKGILQKDLMKEKVGEQITFLERLVSFKKYKSHIESQLREARMNISVKRFIFQRMFMAGSIAILVIILYLVTDQQLYLYLTIPLSILAYKIPKRSIAKNRLYYNNQLKIQLPEYLIHFGVLLDNNTAYEATKKSREYAGPLLKPYVDRLVAQIALYPASHRPYYEFSESVGSREAKEFMAAMEQIMKVDAKKASKIIQDQIRIMNELLEEAYNEQIEKRPEQIEPYIYAMLFPFVGTIINILFILISVSVSEM